jgi:hypothetical protein
MDIHDCSFSIARLHVRFQGIPYEISECEQCGDFGLRVGSGQEGRVVLVLSDEFNDVIDFVNYLVQSLRKQQRIRQRDTRPQLIE